MSKKLIGSFCDTVIQKRIQKKRIQEIIRPKTTTLTNMIIFFSFFKYLQCNSHDNGINTNNASNPCRTHDHSCTQSTNPCNGHNKCNNIIFFTLCFTAVWYCNGEQCNEWYATNPKKFIKSSIIGRPVFKKKLYI